MGEDGDICGKGSSAVGREAHSGRNMVREARPWHRVGVSGCRAGHPRLERKGWVPCGGGPLRQGGLSPQGSERGM